mmetsp:Transcript_6113/g.14547  ORF Transcript_6113/g.14547 Transcript_6113/m.14547 type:complete len:202 (-) Transcript_6113:1009-1614(-)
MLTACLVYGWLTSLRTMRSTAVSGTDTIMPPTPHSLAHSSTVKSTTTGWSASPIPKTLGSITEPTRTWMHSGIMIARVPPIQLSAGSSSTMGSGNRVDTTEPTFGTKFAKKATAPKRKARSTRSRASVPPLSTATNSESADLSTMYLRTCVSIFSASDVPPSPSPSSPPLEPPAASAATNPSLARLPLCCVCALPIMRNTE